MRNLSLLSAAGLVEGYRSGEFSPEETAVRAARVRTRHRMAHRDAEPPRLTDPDDEDDEGARMARYITITLDKRGVSCTVRLLDDEAPATAAAVWDALPLSAPVYHGKYARNEIYALLPQFADRDPGKENTTVTPIPGDVCWFTFDGNDLANPAYGYESEQEHRSASASIIDLAIFYGRNNLLINGDQGWVPGNVFGTITEGLAEMAEACQDVWMGGARGETLSFAPSHED